MKYTSLLLLIAIITACGSSQKVYKADFDPVSKNELPAEGIFYHLPATILKIEVTAQKTIEKRGPYYRYSQRYLNLTDIITEDGTEWEITNAQISTKGIPDPDRMFQVTIDGVPSGAAVNLTPEGILKGINMPNNTHPQPNTGEHTQTVTTFEEISTSPDDLTFDETPFTEEQLIKTSGAATAEEVAAEIYRLRDARRRLLDSDMQTLPPDDGAYKRILQGLDKMEKEYLSLFRGKQETITVSKTFTFFPDLGAPNNQVLFRFSSQKGFTDTSDMSGTPVYIEVQFDKEAIENNPTIPERTEEERSGMIYCRPVKATVKVIDRTLLLNEKEFQIAQFGSLHQLPPSLLDNPNTSIQLDPVTGALIEIKTNH